MTEHYVPVARVVRSQFVEGEHAGTVVAVDPDGSVAWALGDPGVPVLPRSTMKLVQAAAMVRLGVGLPLGEDPVLLALAAASHSGEPQHVDGVRRMLAGAGLDEGALQNTADWPLDEASRLALQREGGGPSAVAMNCSGKHAAMVATCTVRGWDLETYLASDHPLQERLRAEVEQVTGDRVVATAVDGCGAPAWAVTLTGLARGYGSAVQAELDSPERRVADAMRAHPDLVGGTGRPVTAFMREVPGLLAKDGAEGVFAAALPDGRAFAVKVADGAPRAAQVVLAGALRRALVESGDGPGAAAADRLARVPVLGHGRPVGEVLPLL